MAGSETVKLSEDDVIQIAPPHKWGGCLAVVDEVKGFGCQAYVTIPANDGTTGPAYIRLNWDEFEALGVKAAFHPRRSLGEDKDHD
jgi:hypothetical protein